MKGKGDAVMEVSRPNPVIDRIIERQKREPGALRPSSHCYCSNIYDTSKFLDCILKRGKEHSKGPKTDFDDPEKRQQWLAFWEQARVTGERYITLSEKGSFPNGDSIRVMLETMDAIDQQEGVTWRKSIFHNHDFFELLYVYSGRCTTTISGVETELSAGDICIYNLQAVHQIGIAAEQDTVFNILIKKELFEQTFLQLQSGNSLVTDFFLHSLYHIQSPGQNLVFHPQDDSRCEALLQMMIEEYYQTRPLGQEFLKSMLAALFTELFHQYYEMISTLSCQEPGCIDIAQVIEFIGSRYASVTLEETAEHFGYTPRSMIRFLKKYTHSTFRSIVQGLRLKQAAAFLKDSDKSIDEIAAAIGYSDRSYFHKLFREHYGMTPVEYRQKCRQ